MATTRRLATVLPLALLGALAVPAGTAIASGGTNYAETFASLNPGNWDVYNSPGHDGNGLRRPSQVSVANHILTITGTANGTTGGLKWRHRSQTYGQWDILMRAPAGCICYHPVVLLWGTGGGSGVNNPNGEIDIVEAWQRPRRDRNSFTVHYGDGRQLVGADTAVNMTAWHVYHLVWRADYIYTWIDDNVAYATVDDLNVIPDGPMDLAIQLDWFPSEGTAGGATASMQVAVIQQWFEPVQYR